MSEERNAGKRLLILFLAIVVPLALAVSLSGCDQRDDRYRTAISVETRWYEIIDYNPPKRFYVTLKDVDTGEIFYDVYVSKRCYGLPQNLVGTRWEMKAWKYQGRYGFHTEVVGAQCERFRHGRYRLQ